MADVTGVEVTHDGPNRVSIPDMPVEEGQRLVVWVSDCPGWRLRVDGKPAKLTPVNDYLGAKTVPGTHRYTFTFAPPCIILAW